jgi:predicted nucleotidyltransferase component of viral defense system
LERMPERKLDYAQIRRTAIAALFSDDVLTDYLVLKGGNALDIVYGITSRTSMDLDFSMKEDFEDSTDARERFFSALRDRFDAVGYVLFDERFAARPELKGADDEKPWWGGYEISFKLIEREKYHSFKDRLDKLRINALVIGGSEKRSFKIDLSKCEYTDGKAEHKIDQFTIYVYTPTMIAVEKIRAVCQQMPEYSHTGNKKARARDFYDVYQVLTTYAIDLSTEENKALVRHIFDAKQVPLSLLGYIDREREFHRPDWHSVLAATSGQLQDFDFYFNFVIGEVDRLKSLGVE